MSKCPVCGNPINKAAASAKTGETAYGAKEIDPAQGTRQFHDGKWHYFDSLGCRTRFMANPDKYLNL